MPSWRSYLTAQGAHWDDLGVSHFGDQRYPDFEPERPNLVDLSHWACLEVSGPEARKFLQGQVTCDMNRVDIEHPSRGAQCNVKGRAVFSFYIVQRNAIGETDSFVLLMPRSMLELAHGTLAKFIVFSKAELSIPEQFQLLGLIGPALAQLANQVFQTCPPPEQSSTNGATTLVRINEDRLLCLFPANQAESIWRQLASQCQPCGYPTWNLSSIRAGMGEVEALTSGEFIPQSLNFHLTNGISFTKGCYIGQEVVARMEYRGTLKRHLRRAKIHSNELPPAGATVFGATGQQSIGNVVTAAAIDADSIEILAVVTDQAFNQNDAFLGQQKIHKLQFLPLPYAITK